MVINIDSVKKLLILMAIVFCFGLILGYALGSRSEHPAARALPDDTAQLFPNSQI